jgi:hypothetical protein
MGIQNKMTREWPRGFGDIRVAFGDKWENPSTTMEEGTLTSFPQRRNQQGCKPQLVRPPFHLRKLEGNYFLPERVAN